MKIKNRRWTCRSFKTNPIEKNILEDVVYYASKAPVGMNLYNKFLITIVDSDNVGYLRKHLMDHFHDEDVTYNATSMIIINVNEDAYKIHKSTCDKSAGAIAVVLESMLIKHRLGASISESIYDFYEKYKVGKLQKGKVILKNKGYVPILAIFVGYPKNRKSKESHHPIKFSFYSYHKDDDDRFK